MKTRTTTTATTETNGIMARLEQLNQRAQALFAAFQEKVKPVAAVGTIIAAVYSAVAVLAFLLSMTGSRLYNLMADSTVCIILFGLLFVGAMVGLVTTGGILTALWMFLKAAGKIFGRGHILDVGSFLGFIVSVAFNLIFSFIALFIVAVALFAVPIVPILVRQKKCAA